MTDLQRGKSRVRGFHDQEMEFQLLRQLGACAGRGAAPGECFALAGQIEDGNPASWVQAFARLADRQEQDGLARAARGHHISARDQLLRASNTYRAAEYYTSALEPPHRQLGLRARGCFHEAMKYVGHTFEPLALPYRDLRLPAYFMAPAPDGARRKTLLLVSGYDGTLEEEYLMRGYPALERGYNLVLFAGPGQMDTLRQHPDTYFQPDFEGPVREVVRFCAGRAEVDMERLALLGISFGGYFATRAAAHEPRIRALLANSPIVDLHAYLSAFVGFDPAEMPEAEDFRLKDLPGIPDSAMPPHQRIMSENLMARFGKRSFRDTFRYLREFRVGEALAAIRCPALALAGSGEGAEPLRQLEAFARGVSGPVTTHVFTEQEGADGHCQVGNPAHAAAVCFDWLDELFG